MKIIWLGQAGLYFENEKIKIMIDPYLSDSVVKVNPKNFRRVPIDNSYFGITPDVLICTHDHLDHLDPETVPVFVENALHPMVVMGSEQCFSKLVAMGGVHNYVMMKPHTEFTVNGVRFTAVRAFHSETTAVGFIIDDGEKKYYVTGDTLYNEEIFDSIPNDIDVLFLPINGVGNNMNAQDAARFAKRIGAKYTVPYHFGMFDELDPTVFSAPGRVIPELYKQINFE